MAACVSISIKPRRQQLQSMQNCAIGLGRGVRPRRVQACALQALSGLRAPVVSAANTPAFHRMLFVRPSGYQDQTRTLDALHINLTVPGLTLCQTLWLVCPLADTSVQNIFTRRWNR